MTDSESLGEPEILNEWMSDERLVYLTGYVMDKLMEADIGTDFCIRTGPNDFAYVAPEDSEILLVTVRPARLEVSKNDEGRGI